ncbi:MAG: hypothetical protein AVDCRST_MAG54-1909, partial [uncultured Actinomycetospora sp.]
DAHPRAAVALPRGRPRSPHAAPARRVRPVGRDHRARRGHGVDAVARHRRRRWRGPVVVRGRRRRGRARRRLHRGVRATDGGGRRALQLHRQGPGPGGRLRVRGVDGRRLRDARRGRVLWGVLVRVGARGAAGIGHRPGAPGRRRARRRAGGHRRRVRDPRHPPRRPGHAGDRGPVHRADPRRARRAGGHDDAGGAGARRRRPGWRRRDRRRRPARAGGVHRVRQRRLAGRGGPPAVRVRAPRDHRDGRRHRRALPRGDAAAHGHGRRGRRVRHRAHGRGPELGVGAHGRRHRGLVQRVRARRADHARAGAVLPGPRGGGARGAGPHAPPLPHAGDRGRRRGARPRGRRGGRGPGRRRPRGGLRRPARGGDPGLPRGLPA